MVAIPDPDTFVVMPWRSGESKVGRMICDIVTPSGEPYEGDPRYVLRRALERMKGMGFDTFNVGPELEYFLFKDSRGTETLDEGGYFAMTTQDAATELRNETIKALESVGLGERLHHTPNQLSGGQQQRVAIARALVTNPPLLLADEPTGNLDTRTSLEVLDLLQKLNETGITIVLVTHEHDIAACASRVVTMRDGRVKSDIVSDNPTRAAESLAAMPPVEA